MSEQSASFQFDGWADIQFMGHRRRIAKVRTDQIGGTAIFVVDAPNEAGGFDTEVYAASALYAFRPLSEEIARAMAPQINPQPVNAYELPDDWRVAIATAERTKQERARAIAAESVTITLRPDQAALLNGAVYGTPEMQEISETIEAAIVAKKRELERMRPRGYGSTYGSERDDEDGPY